VATLEIEGLTKRFGDVVAVEDLSFLARPGAVTGFLGPNGAGKTTTLRMLLGLTSPSAGTATIDGRRYGELEEPFRYVGAVLESSGFYPGRRARDHLRVLAAAAGLPLARVDAVLEQVGLAGAGARRVKGYSLGMRQRLGLAGALLGEPDVLILDEPANGLDPAGVSWLRRFLRGFADEGGTVLVSSHLLAEMAQMVDEVVIIANGRLVIQSSLAELARQSSSGVRVRTPQADVLRAELTARGVAVERDAADALVAFGTTTEAVGRAAVGAGVVVYEITAERFDLEQVFLELTTTDGAIE
jgi:ABC-2 type transport system ATP-binding protein